MFSKSFIFLSSSWVLETRRESKRGREMKEEKLSLYHKIAWAALLLELEALFSLASAEGQGDEPSIPQASGREWQNLFQRSRRIGVFADFKILFWFPKWATFDWGHLICMGRGPWTVGLVRKALRDFFSSHRKAQLVLINCRLSQVEAGCSFSRTNPVTHQGGRTKRMAPVCINTAVQLCLHWNTRNRSPPGEYKRQGGYSTTHRSFSWDSWTTTWRERVRLLPYSWLLVI